MTPTTISTDLFWADISRCPLYPAAAGMPLPSGPQTVSNSTFPFGSKVLRFRSTVLYVLPESFRIFGIFAP
ncbi:hypothetical protein [Kaistella rhinocerotis]|uniref:hypothetical protein n=1 Tax=Kaistella rhinocerotis TaxID=3026437 RepID=UPI002553351B|nr:hypothetical protein [Kaistella sp. Ran72]